MPSPDDLRHPATTFPVRDAFVTSRDDAPAYWFNDTLWIVLADVHQTGGSFSVLEQWMRAGVGPPLHVHTVDEWFFVFSGSMDMQVGQRTLTATGGDSVWIPRGKPAERRELLPEDLELPNFDAFGRLLDNYWSSLSTNSWALTAPQRT
jgi:mannose-6-phosphate isomerase-like protein (cupin superfamily)